MFWLFFSFIALGLAYLGKEPTKQVPSRNRHYLVFRSLLVILLALVVGFGGQVFTDHATYEMVYNSYESETITIKEVLFNGFASKLAAVEPGFLLLARACKFLNLGYAGFFTVIGLLTNFFFVCFFYRFRLPVVSLLLFITSAYFLQEMNLVRQMLVVSIFLNALAFIEEGNWIKYSVTIVLCSFLHTAVILLLILLPLCFIDIKHRSNNLRVVFVILWIISLLVALKFVGLGLEKVNLGIEMYGKYMTTQNRMGVTVKFDLIYNLLIAYMLFMRKNMKWDIYSIALFLGAFFFNIALQAPNIYRFGYYFAPCFCAMAPAILREDYNNKNRMYASSGLFLLILYHSYIIFSRIIHPFELLGQQWYSWSEFFL